MTNEMSGAFSRPQCPECGRMGEPLTRFCAHCGSAFESGGVVDATGVIAAVVEDPSGTGPIPVVMPRPATGAVLIVVKGQDTGTQFDLDADVTTLGRAKNANVFLDDVTVSRRHAEILHTSSGWLLRDQASLNGTYVNRDRVDEYQLKDGDEVQIGKYRFIFRHAEVKQ